ncbi:hypothetical protein DYB37_001316 [Aphanomyces astaci]|uniref:Uncharacterized protein n=1 Tax=Aphanomyces astaci TaxID=112090 RepID=A0A3R6ZLX3_APHAT|nr:hypothetical protein DYB35_001208 [Aphanomyces astaci]RHZ23248.1 hypothetical protein DYB37_001316 [Aphanomyces astaci]
MSALDYVLPDGMEDTNEGSNYLEEVDMELPQPYSLRLINNPCHHTGQTTDNHPTSRLRPREFHSHSCDEDVTDVNTASSIMLAEHNRSATLLARIREKVFARLATCDNDSTVSSDKDYLAPDNDSDDDDDPQDEHEDSHSSVEVVGHPVSRKRDLQSFLLGGRSLDTPSSSAILPMPPSSMPIPFLFLPPPPSLSSKPSLSGGSLVAKCLLPAVPHRPPLRKYNHRSIYNCVRCGQMKKHHTCTFPENVRSVGTAMSSTSLPRDTVSRYYKCGRVLVCKK